MIIKRILVAIDASPYSLAALAAAADLAEKLQVELCGLYVEDINLLRLAELPFAREFRYSRPESHKLDSVHMAEQLRLQAALARRHFEDLAAARKLLCSFQVVRGAISGELENAAQETDLLVLGRISRSLLRTNRLGSTAKTAVARAQQSILLTHAQADLNRPILLIYDGSEAAERALTMAIHLGGGNGRYHILIHTTDDQKAQIIKSSLDLRFKTEKLAGSFRRLYRLNTPEIAHLLHMTQSGVLIVNLNNEQLTLSLTKELLETLDCTLLLVK